MATLIKIYNDRISIRSGLTKEEAVRKGEKFQRKNDDNPRWNVLDGDVVGEQKQDIQLLSLGDRRITAPIRLLLTASARPRFGNGGV